MNPLPTTFTAKRFEFTQLVRNESWAVYRKRLPTWPEGTFSWEVIHIGRQKETQWKDVTFPARETYPGDELFGVRGWTHMSEAAAMADFRMRSSTAGQKSARVAP